MAQMDESVVADLVIAPADGPASLEASPRFGLGNRESAREYRRVSAHVGDTLVIGRPLRASDTTSRTPEIPREDGEIDASGRNLCRIAVATGFIVGDRLIDERGWVRPIRC